MICESSEQHLPTSCEAGSKVSIYRQCSDGHYTHIYTQTHTMAKVFEHIPTPYLSVMVLIQGDMLKPDKYFVFVCLTPQVPLFLSFTQSCLFFWWVCKRAKARCSSLFLFLPFFNFYPWCCSSKRMSLLCQYSFILSVLLFMMCSLAF